MDQDKIKRLQSFKVIVSEVIMVVAVILIVIVLALVVSGYWLNSDFKVERQGLLQISSIPTGASVEIDGDTSWLQRTNTSKVLTAGEHTINLAKEGYDTWSKTINIREGLLYRIHYPRLFLKERASEKVMDPNDATFATISPDHDTLLIVNSTSKWQVISLNNEKITQRTINVSAFFSSSADQTETDNFNGQILSADWARDNVHILLKVKNDDAIEWVLLDVANIKNSINLSKEFDASFDDIKIVNNSASSLLVLKNQNLRRIDVPNKQFSAIMAENVVSFDHFENEVVFLATKSDKSGNSHYLASTKIGDDNNLELASFDSGAQVLISKFYDEKYITIVNANLVSLYKETDFEKVNDFELSFAPKRIKVGHDGEFIIMTDGTKIATLDMEALEVKEWEIASSDYGWLDNDMLYAIDEGDLVVYDFDGLNRRDITKNVTSNFPATITDDKWLYYFSDGKLIREWLIAR